MQYKITRTSDLMGKTNYGDIDIPDELIVKLNELCKGVDLSLHGGEKNLIINTSRNEVEVYDYYRE